MCPRKMEDSPPKRWRVGFRNFWLSQHYSQPSQQFLSSCLEAGCQLWHSNNTARTTVANNNNNKKQVFQSSVLASTLTRGTRSSMSKTSATWKKFRWTCVLERQKSWAVWQHNAARQRHTSHQFRLLHLHLLS